MIIIQQKWMPKMNIHNSRWETQDYVIDQDYVIYGLWEHQTIYDFSHWHGPSFSSYPDSRTANISKALNVITGQSVDLENGNFESYAWAMSASPYVHRDSSLDYIFVGDDGWLNQGRAMSESFVFGRHKFSIVPSNFQKALKLCQKEFRDTCQQIEPYEVNFSFKFSIKWIWENNMVTGFKCYDGNEVITYENFLSRRLIS